MPILEPGVKADGLNQRLEDKAHEVAGLSRQLAAAQQNLEHYRETARTQREQERADFEFQRKALKQALRDAREEIQILRGIQQRFTEEGTLARSEQDRLREELEGLAGQRDTLAGSLAAAEVRLAEVEGRLKEDDRVHQETAGRLQVLPSMR